MGITDRQTEGVFRYVNGETVNVIRGQPFLYFFAAGEPNSAGDEDCVVVKRKSELNDIGCSYSNINGFDFHGLCEMKNFIF